MLASHWQMPFASSRGYSSLTLQHDVAELIKRRYAKTGQRTIIYFVSDLDPSGQTLAESRGVGEEILYAEIDPARARRKHVIRVPGKHEIDRLADRRPEMYGVLVQPHSLKSPGRS